MLPCEQARRNRYAASRRPEADRPTASAGGPGHAGGADFPAVHADMLLVEKSLAYKDGSGDTRFRRKTGSVPLVRGVNLAMMDRSTILAARIMGPALSIFGAALLAGRVSMGDLVSTLIAEPTTRLFAAAVSVILGLVLAVLHNRWKTPTEIAITLIGWALVLRGTSLLIAPSETMTAFQPVFEASALPLVSGGLMFALGGWFTFVGFVRKTS